MLVMRIKILILITMIGWCHSTLLHAEPPYTTRILLLGDSIIAGYGLAAHHTLDHLLQQQLNANGVNAQIINGGVSGDTTSGGRGRLEWMINQHQPDLVFIALGGNDMLRATPPHITRQNIEAIIQSLQTHNIDVVLSFVTASTQLGKPYQDAFNRLYPELAEAYGVIDYPFLLNDVFGKATFMQSDGIHPNAKGVEVIAEKLSAFFIEQLQNASIH